jgi:hypothetical protein
MSRLPRPHIPLAVRVHVAERQCRERGISPLSPTEGVAAKPRRLSDRLSYNLRQLFGDRKAELHHRPALVNRRRRRNGDYDPPANDPAHLVYLVDADHDVETRVRGQHGAHSDLGMARKNKRIAKNRDPKRRKAKIAQRKHPWPKRQFPKRSTRPK